MTRTRAQLNGGTAPDWEWAYTFSGSQNPAFTMGPRFGFSPAWDSVAAGGDRFADAMFIGCNGAAFTMNNVFNLPRNITAAGDSFASGMFSGCDGAAFLVNGVFTFPRPASLGSNAFQYTFKLGSGAASQTRTATNIINGNTAPGSDMDTFGPSGGVWSDYTSIDANWRE
ncbi:MAG: hypothetical protein LBQ14_09765 [Treponema sp.]|jgi:hypothetical protein|nr:hypothetical protein [Treponema sp.]